jgi:hypothetical protein
MALWGGQAPAKAGEAAGKNLEDLPKISVSTYGYVPISSQTYEDSKKVASRILARAGIEIVWLDCRLEGSDLVKPAACDTRLRPDEITLRILTFPKNTPRGLRPTLGVSLLSKEGGRGSLASVYYDRAVEMARSGGVSPSIVLGHAMAHELGHLLLKTGVHTATGLMRAAWQTGEVRRAARWALDFSGHQAKAMRAEALARMEDGRTMLAGVGFEPAAGQRD